jgi:hypothetical protein
MPVQFESGFTIDRIAAEEAVRLLTIHGPSAGATARRQASHHWRRENVAGYCRWREIARLISILSDGADQTRH